MLSSAQPCIHAKGLDDRHLVSAVLKALTCTRNCPTTEGTGAWGEAVEPWRCLGVCQLLAARPVTAAAPAEPSDACISSLLAHVMKQGPPWSVHNWPNSMHGNAGWKHLVGHSWDNARALCMEWRLPDSSLETTSSERSSINTFAAAGRPSC